MINIAGSINIGPAKRMKGFIIDIIVKINRMGATDSIYCEKILALYNKIVG
jgi:hypothetical protein